jgi:hypothetical protein
MTPKNQALLKYDELNQILEIYSHRHYGINASVILHERMLVLKV